MSHVSQSLDRASELFRQHFGESPTSRAFAPGRIEVIGNHLDYNGGTVVGSAIDIGIAVAMRRRKEGAIRITSDDRRGDGVVETTVESYREQTRPDWTSYPLGVFDEARLRGWSLDQGFDMAISSSLPVGVGLSSSAALEMATAGALVELLNDSVAKPSRSALVEIAHRAENRFVGMPCGLLDQSVVGHARENNLVVLDAATNRSLSIAMPPGAEFVVFRSHITHALVDSPYEERHRECREAHMALERFIPGIRHLARLHPADLDAYASTLETRASLRARHVVHEQRRVGAFLSAINKGDLESAGACMTASHDSSRAFFDNSTPELDALAALSNKQPGVLGSRLSGGGWGGATVSLIDGSFEQKHAEVICDQYEELFDIRPHWWRTSASAGLVHEQVPV